MPEVRPAVLHLSHAATASDGGIATTVGGLVAAQTRAGLAVEWLTADRHAASLRDRALLRQVRAAGADLVHVHGLWRSPTRVAPRLAAEGLPLLIAPHGMLDPWAMEQSRWKKRLVWRLWERRALEGARCLQALTAAEAEAIRACGLAQPVAVIPNGVTLPDPAGPLPEPPWQDQVAAGERVLLFLGRFHAKKGLNPLLQAWRAMVLEARVHGWWLALVGFGDDGALAARVSAEGVERCLVLGPCFGDHKAACLHQASAFILPSYSEGMPMAALEAMSWGLPCLLSPSCHLPEAFEAGAALSITVDSDGIALGLRSLFSATETSRGVMGERGRQLVSECFSWNRVATMTSELYRWIGGEGPCPRFVQDARLGSGS